MKKLLHIILCLVVVLSFNACQEPPSEVNFNTSFLYGKWQEGSVFEHYYASKVMRILPSHDTVWVNGTTWDEEDVNEEEAQLFNWTLTNATLMHEHIGVFTTVPKLYTITMLTSKTLIYKDDYGVTHHFSKVE